LDRRQIPSFWIVVKPGTLFLGKVHMERHGHLGVKIVTYVDEQYHIGN